MRSDTIKKGLERVPHRALMHATGLSRRDLGRPYIGVASSFTDLVPGHVGMKDLERFIERGVCFGGAVPFFFGIPAICDGIAMGHLGMCYPLASRELIADSVESVCNAHQLDGIVCLTNCDKITPGMIMAAARLNIPALIVTAGPMLSGHFRKRKLAFVHDTYEGLARAKKGDISEEELTCLEMEACPGAGSCQGLYTEYHGLFDRDHGHVHAGLRHRFGGLRQKTAHCPGQRRADRGNGPEKYLPAGYHNRTIDRECHYRGYGLGRFQQYRAAFNGYRA